MPRALRPSHPIVQCGAKRRDGNACTATALPNGKCRMHGGTNPGAPKGNQHNSKLGIYAKILHPDEVALAEGMETGTLLAEIHLIKLQIARVERARRAYDECIANGETPTKHLVLMRMKLQLKVEKGDGAEIADEEMEVVEREMKRPDFEEMLDRFTGRLERLEKTEAQLNGTLRSSGSDDDDDEGGNGASVTIRIIGGLPDAPPDAAS